MILARSNGAIPLSGVLFLPYSEVRVITPSETVQRPVSSLSCLSSQVTTRRHLPAIHRYLFMKAVARREIDMVAAWSVDRLGRSLTGLLELLTELHAKKVDLYLHQQGLDTSTPSGRAMFQMMGVFAEFERAMIRERVLAGLARAKQDGIHLGRKFTEDTKDGNRKIKAALAMRAKGVGIRKIAREVGLGVGTVLRLTATS